MAELKKVIRALENCTDEIKCRDCPWETCETFCLSVEVPLDLAKAALSLLKAQEPKPPRFVVTFDKIFYACDNCGKSLLVVANAEGIKGLSNMPKYCPECGQAVKWDEPPKEET